MGRKLAEVVSHRGELRLAEEARLTADEGDVMKGSGDVRTPFMPNLLNTCVFLVDTAQQVAVLINYKGRPWMKNVTENRALFLSVVACVASCAACAWGIALKGMIHLEPFPDDDFRFRVMGLVAASSRARSSGPDLRPPLRAGDLQGDGVQAAALSVADCCRR